MKAGLSAASPILRSLTDRIVIMTMTTCRPAATRRPGQKSRRRMIGGNENSTGQKRFGSHVSTKPVRGSGSRGHAHHDHDHHERLLHQTDGIKRKRDTLSTQCQVVHLHHHLHRPRHHPRPLQAAPVCDRHSRPGLPRLSRNRYRNHVSPYFQNQKDNNVYQRPHLFQNNQRNLHQHV